MNNQPRHRPTFRQTSAHLRSRARRHVVTVRVTTLKGAGAGRYYTEHLPSYYLDGDEPPGRWWGRGADRLGLRMRSTRRRSWR